MKQTIIGFTHYYIYPVKTACLPGCKYSCEMGCPHFGGYTDNTKEEFMCTIYFNKE